jgi:hypothetical protein
LDQQSRQLNQLLVTFGDSPVKTIGDARRQSAAPAWAPFPCNCRPDDISSNQVQDRHGYPGGAGINLAMGAAKCMAAPA